MHPEAALAPARPVGATVVVALPLLAMLATLWPALHFVWTERSAYTHGYLILGVALFLCYRELRRGGAGGGPSSIVGLVVLAASVVAAAGGRAADVALLAQLGVPAIALSAVWAAEGWATARRYWLPAAYLIFAIPLWDSINDLLQAWTVAVVGWLTRLSSIPAFIEGNSIRIPSGTFVVEGGCSGLHYLIVACALSVLYGVLTFDRWLARLYALAFGVVLALVANWIRVFVVIVAGHLTDMQHYLVTVDHYYFGWVLFFVVFAPLLLFGHRIEALAPSTAMRRPPRRESAPSARAATSHNGYLVVATGSLLLAGTALSVLANARPEAPRDSRAIGLPASIGAWTRMGAWEDGSRPRFTDADEQGTGRYVLGSSHVTVFLGRYAVQRQGNEVVFYSNRPSGEGAEVMARTTARLGLASGETVYLAELEVVDPDGVRRVVWYGYEIAGSRARDALRAKLYQVAGAFRRRWDAQVIVVSAPCEPDCGAAREALSHLMSAGYELVLASSAKEESQ